MPVFVIPKKRSGKPDAVVFDGSDEMAWRQANQRSIGDTREYDDSHPLAVELRDLLKRMMEERPN